MFEEDTVGEGVGDRIRNARRTAELTQSQLAEALAVEAITVSRWERGVTTPSLARLARIAQATGTAVSELVLPSDEAPPHVVELAELRREFDELRGQVERMVRALGRLALPGQTGRRPAAGPDRPW
jgi:transcriptional regulator with XRE-family HTH domain